MLDLVLHFSGSCHVGLLLFCVFFDLLNQVIGISMFS